ncbi:MAG: MerR family transcriptional regulator [Bacteroidetes bacterium HGW-Bacteroidetes-17]|nr:MAG: MerR family transcriptional regulator [Bacteroidetes bacterium HGW-Bacteroidetes-17]
MKYSMTQIENLTGIKAHTLRIWERRYHFLKPDRTDSNIRYYSDEQLRLLLNIDILSRNGYRISQIDKMSVDEVNNQVLRVMSNESSDNKDEINALTASMLKMDEREFDQIFTRRVTRSGLLNTIKDLIYPFLNHIGVLWGADKAIPAQEHFISNLIRQKLIAAIDMIPIPVAQAPKILFFLPEGEDHEIGLLLSSFIAKDLGWRVYYLGQKVPVNNMKDAIQIAKPDLLMTMLITPRANKLIQSFYSIIKESSVALLISGNATNFPVEMTSPDFVFISNPDGFVSYLQHWKRI